MDGGTGSADNMEVEGEDQDNVGQAPAGSRANFVNIQPVRHGVIWLKIHGEQIEKYGQRDRVSFVFKSQKTIISRAYEALARMNEEDQ